MSPGRVLVPLDGSAVARRTVPVARALAVQLDWPLELLTVYDPVRRTWERELDEIAASLSGLEVEATLVASSAPGEVIRDLARQSPTVVCMATRGRDAVDRMLLGSTTSHVLGAGVPAVLTGPQFDDTRSAIRYDRLVVGVDPSVVTAWAAARVREWGMLLDLEVDLVHVRTPTARRSSDDDEARVAALAVVIGEGCSVRQRHVQADTAAAGLLEVGCTSPTSLITLISRRHSGWRRLLVGSVTAEVLSASRVPVLVQPGRAPGRRVRREA